MGLLLKMDREVDDPVSAYHKTNFKIQVDVAGEELSYVVCPKTFMRDHADGTALGFNEDGKIFLARDLHPTQMPFVALYLHYSGMDSGELSKKFGAETFAGLTHEETDTILLATVLDLAKDYLRPQEMTGLIERLKKEKGHNSQREEVYSKVAAAYLSTEVSSTALAKREEQSLEFYVGRISEKVSAHAHNKHVSTSRFFSTALEGRDKDQMRAWITSAEPAYQAIIDDPSFRANLSNVVRFLEALEGYQPGTVITLPVEESRLMYLCQNASESYRSKARPVFNFRDGPSVPFQNTENYLEITKATAKFIQAVRLRLLNVLARDYEEAEKLVEGLKDVVRKVGSGDEDLTARLDGVVRQYKSLLPEQVSSTTEAVVAEAVVPAAISADERAATLEEAVDTAVEHRQELGYALTSAPVTLMDLHKAYRARHLLEELGLSTEVVDTKIGQLNEAGSAGLASLVRKRLL